MKYKHLFPANSNKFFKAGWYFTGQCLALDEHPQFREQIIELFAEAKDSISFLKDGIPGPAGAFLQVSHSGGDLEGASIFLKGTANLLDGLYSDVGERMIGRNQ